MDFSGIDPWLFAGGLGFFLFGMQQLEAGLKIVGGHLLERVLRRSTGHPLASIGVGIGATALLQSSSLVGLMMLAFVGAGILPMRNAVGVILGANLGTTFTGWMVTAIGFKLNLNEFAIPILAVGSLGAVFLERRPRAWGLSLLILGLGLLLFGLGLMKQSVELFSRSLDLGEISHAHPYWFFLTGFAFAAIIQSSSATMMITLSALDAGIIALPDAAAIVIGADLGTTSTLMLGSLRGSAASRQVALAHLLYNVVTAVIALFVLLPLIDIGLERAGIADPLIGLVSFHSIFNVVGIILFLPFIRQFADFLEGRFVRLSRGRAQYLDRTPPGIDVAAIAALEAETRTLVGAVIELNRRCFKIGAPADRRGLSAWFGSGHPGYEAIYATLKHIEGEILDYARSILAATRSPELAARTQTLLGAVRDAVYAAKGIKDIRANMLEFRHLEQTPARLYVERLTTHMRDFYAAAEQVLSAKDAPPDESAGNLLSGEASFSQAISADFYREEESANLSDLQSSTFLNVLHQVDSSNTALIRALQALASAR